MSSYPLPPEASQTPSCLAACHIFCRYGAPSLADGRLSLASYAGKKTERLLSPAACRREIQVGMRGYPLFIQASYPRQFWWLSPFSGLSNYLIRGTVAERIRLITTPRASDYYSCAESGCGKKRGPIGTTLPNSWRCCDQRPIGRGSDRGRAARYLGSADGRDFVAAQRPLGKGATT